MCRRKQTAQKQTWSSWEFKFFMFVFPTAAFIFCFHKKRLFAKFYSANVIHGSCIDDKYTQTLSSIKTHHNLICQKVLRKIKNLLFLIHLPFINILRFHTADEKAKIKLFGINIFNMWHIQSAFAKILEFIKQCISIHVRASLVFLPSVLL